MSLTPTQRAEVLQLRNDLLKSKGLWHLLTDYERENHISNERMEFILSKPAGWVESIDYSDPLETTLANAREYLSEHQD